MKPYFNLDKSWYLEVFEVADYVNLKQTPRIVSILQNSN